MQRRSLLKTLGGIGAVATVGGAGLLASTGGAAAATINISGGNPSVSNDRGDLSELTVDPDFDVTWDGFDDAVGKVFFLLEAKVDDGEYQPIYRATPWLDLETIGTSGTFERQSGLLPRRIVVADEAGKPDYEGADWANYAPASYETYMDGTSMGSAQEAEDNLALTLQNNFADANAGYYGAASDTTPFDNDDDQSTEAQTTEVTLRYTLELQRPNLSQLKYAVGESSSVALPSGYDNLTEEAKKAALADRISGVQAGDIDAGNSRIVMEGEDDYASFDSYADGAGIPYDVLQNNDSHPGIITTSATLNVDVTNETSDGGATGDTNGQAS